MSGGTMQRRDRWIPWYFVLFFVVVALVDAVMVTLAVRTHSGPVTDHPYEKGLAYNRVVEAQRAQEEWGWRTDIALEGGRLRVTLYDAQQRLLEPEHVLARFSRPTSAGMDFEVTLAHGQADIVFPQPGLWEVRIFATHGGKTFQQSRRLVVE